MRRGYPKFPRSIKSTTQTTMIEFFLSLEPVKPSKLTFIRKSADRIVEINSNLMICKIIDSIFQPRHLKNHCFLSRRDHSCKHQRLWRKRKDPWSKYNYSNKTKKIVKNRIKTWKPKQMTLGNSLNNHNCSQRWTTNLLKMMQLARTAVHWLTWAIKSSLKFLKMLMLFKHLHNKTCNSQILTPISDKSSKVTDSSKVIVSLRHISYKIYTNAPLASLLDLKILQKLTIYPTLSIKSTVNYITQTKTLWIIHRKIKHSGMIKKWWSLIIRTCCLKTRRKRRKRNSLSLSKLTI